MNLASHPSETDSSVFEIKRGDRVNTPEAIIRNIGEKKEGLTEIKKRETIDSFEKPGAIHMEKLEKMIMQQYPITPTIPLTDNELQIIKNQIMTGTYEIHDPREINIAA